MEMTKKAGNSKLKGMIQEHIEQTKGQITTLDQVFTALGQHPQREKCAAAAGLVSEALKTMGEAGTDPIRDCLIGGAAAKNVHYEIASYRGLVEGAKAMGQEQVVALIQQNLHQEEQTARKLEHSVPTLLQAAMAAEAK